MTIWIDADSCPRQVRDLVCKRGARHSDRVVFVANRDIPREGFPGVEMVVADTTPDAADDYIVENAEDNDLAITRDIPLASRLVTRGISVINDRGTTYTESNIRERLSMRNFMMDLYNNGYMPEKTGQFGSREMKDFANALDREITRLRKKRESGKGNET